MTVSVISLKRIVFHMQDNLSKLNRAVNVNSHPRSIVQMNPIVTFCIEILDNAKGLVNNELPVDTTPPYQQADFRYNIDRIKSRLDDIQSVIPESRRRTSSQKMFEDNILELTGQIDLYFNMEINPTNLKEFQRYMELESFIMNGIDELIESGCLLCRQRRRPKSPKV